MTQRNQPPANPGRFSLPLGGQEGRQSEPLAGCSRGAQAQNGRSRGAREQDGPRDPGHDDEAGELQNGVT